MNLVLEYGNCQMKVSRVDRVRRSATRPSTATRLLRIDADDNIPFSTNEFP
uniref:Uncharacterized protein n=1 Tax=Candidatus Kentrum sp. DK TaxID=2126562 RepID=A0A450RXB2_9GAMM|nr:MAG: hypothetical protein BECKDK2373B_GA0170837_100654 [Candidatus Kentron sp. DK]